MRHLIVLTVLTLGLAAGSPQASADEPGDLTARITEGQALIRELMRQEKLPGVSVTVLRNGKQIWTEGFGYADLEQKVPVGPETRFRIGSISKTLTAALLGLLVEEGKLDLDQPVQKYAPAYPEKRFPLTTRIVAGHLSGIPHYSEAEFLNHTHTTRASSMPSTSSKTVPCSSSRASDSNTRASAGT